MQKKSVIILIAGGSGSGKTTFAKRLEKILGSDQSTVISQDSYYHDQSHRFDHDGGTVNFDHPSAIDFELLSSHLKQIRNGQDINIPCYDFSTHKRTSETKHVPWKPITIVEGILVMCSPLTISDSCLTIYVDAPEPLRLERRIKRDVEERGRSEQGVRDQYIAQVKPMHDEFVEPCKTMAQILVNPENFDEMLNLVAEKIQLLAS